MFRYVHKKCSEIYFTYWWIAIKSEKLIKINFTSHLRKWNNKIMYKLNIFHRLYYRTHFYCWGYICIVVVYHEIILTTTYHAVLLFCTITQKYSSAIVYYHFVSSANIASKTMWNHKRPNSNVPLQVQSIYVHIYTHILLLH